MSEGLEKLKKEANKLYLKHKIDGLIAVIDLIGTAWRDGKHYTLRKVLKRIAHQKKYDSLRKWLNEALEA